MLPRGLDLFVGYPFDWPVVAAALEGRQAGDLHLDSERDPAIGVLVTVGGDIFLAGDHANPRGHAFLQELFSKDSPYQGRTMVFVPPSMPWTLRLEALFNGRTVRIARRMHVWPGARADDASTNGANPVLPSGMTLHRMDRNWGELCQDHLHDDMFAQWRELDRFLDEGFGFCVAEDDLPVGACLTYSVGDGVAEADVFTAEDYRRQGIAKACAAAFVAQCLREDLTPSWSSHESNEASHRVAERVGFVRGSPYWWLALRPYQRDPDRGILSEE